MNPGPPQPPQLPEFPNLRPGCRFTLHEFEKGPSWVLENPATGKFFRMGLREERLIRRLDGSRSLREILAAAPAAGSAGDFTALEILHVLQMLKSSGLLEEPDRAADSAAPPPKTIFNPMFMRISLGSPDRIFGAIANALSVLPLRPLLALAAALMLAGAYAVFSSFDRFNATMGSVFAAGNIPAFMACFLALKVLHETAHGVVCKLFGGRVPDAGLYFVFFIPLTYIDATASWRMPSKWARILVSSAGMLAELIVAAAAGLIWAATVPGAINTLASNVVISASITTIVFNANPLMRFDGYFILADLSGRPNLYTLAGRAANAWFGRLFLGLPSAQDLPPWITFYGVACLFWRIALVLGLCIGAIALLHGIGLILAILTLTASYFPILKRLPKTVAGWKERGVRLSPLRLSLFALAAGLIFFVPLAPPPAIPAVIEPADMLPVRVQCPGFVREVTVRSGETVKAGQILLRLDNPEENARLGKLTTGSRRAEAQAQTLRETSHPREMSQYLEQADGLAKQAAEVKAYLATLALSAPRDGAVYGRRLGELEGVFLPTGREVLILGSIDRREARIVISEELFDRIRPQIGEAVDVFVPGRLKAYPATVTTVESAATRSIRHEALTALAGGPLAVLTPKNKRPDDKKSGVELVDPHFHITAELAGEFGDSLRSGERGVARFPSAARSTLLNVLIQQVRAFIQQAADRASAPSHP